MVYRGGRKTDNLMGRYKKNDIESYKKLAEVKLKCAEIGISYNAYKQRLYNGWTEEEALTAPTINARQAFYLYKNESARKYLKEHNANYNLFIYYLCKKKKTVDEAVRLTLERGRNAEY